MQIIGYILAILVGVSLGLIGSGGSILTVPILVYIMDVSPITATSYSLFIVGITALIGSIKKAKEKNIEFKTALIIGAGSISVVYLTRLWLLPRIPDKIVAIGNFEITKAMVTMVLFAVVMIFASLSMIRSGNKKEVISSQTPPKRNNFIIMLLGIAVGLITGFVGAGGGFLIIPTLIFAAQLNMKKAVGTSLLIIKIGRAHV